jgi:hypothetical protein
VRPTTAALLVPYENLLTADLIDEQHDAIFKIEPYPCFIILSMFSYKIKRFDKI